MPIKHIFLAVSVAIIWGFNFLFIKIAVQEVPPLFLCALRFLLASIPAVFFVKWPAASFKMVALYGLVMFGLQFSLMFTGLSVGMTASMAALLAQTQVFFSIFFAIIFLGERPTFWQILGALIAFSGIFYVALHLDNTSNSITLPGFLLIIGAAATWGLGNLITKKLKEVDMVSLIAYGSLIACLPLFFISMLIEGPQKIVYSIPHFSKSTVISLAYIVYGSTWLGYGFWNWLLKHYPVTTIVPFSLLVPIFGILGAIFFLGEQFETWKIVASILVISGLCINLLGQRFFGERKVTD